MAQPRGRNQRKRIRSRLVAVAVALVTVLAGIQLVPVDRTNPPVVHDVNAPPPVASALQSACFDCHSRHTRWPWYSKVAPVSWVIAGHVKDGRRALDFSDWPVLDFAVQDDLLSQIARQVGDKKMPPASYRLGHPEARLTAQERTLLVNWAAGLQ